MTKWDGGSLTFYVECLAHVVLAIGLFILWSALSFMRKQLFFGHLHIGFYQRCRPVTIFKIVIFLVTPTLDERMTFFFDFFSFLVIQVVEMKRIISVPPFLIF